MATEFYKSFAFEAARQLGQMPKKYASPCIHGHSFLLNVRQWSEIEDESVVFSHMDSSFSPLIHQMNYGFLNQKLGMKEPSNFQILQWISLQKPEASIKNWTLQSIAGQECRLQSSGLKTMMWSTTLHAAHFLPHVPLGHKCKNLHGHNFHINLHWNVDSDWEALEAESMTFIVQPFFASLNHRLLNEISGLENPTSEIFCAWIWQQLMPLIPSLTEITVYETRTAGCTYGGNLWRGFKTFELDSAWSQKGVLHGYSYTITLFFTSQLDPYLGWTIDYGDIKNRFQECFKTLDHRYLNEVLQTETPSLKAMARFIEARLTPVLPELSGISIDFMPQTGIFYEC